MTNESKRLFLAMFLTFGFLFVWTKFFTPKPPIVPQTTQPTSSAPQSPPVSAPMATTPSSPSLSMPKAFQTETFEFQSDTQNLIFSNDSGAISSIELRNHKVSQAKDAKNISVVPLSQEAPPPLIWNLSFRSSTSGEPTVLSDQKTFYAWTEKDKSQVSLSARPLPQVQVQKTYRVTENPYVIEQVVRIENQSAETLYVDADTSIFSTSAPPSEKSAFSFLQPYSTDIQAVTYARDEAHHWKLKDLADPDSQIKDSSISWAGFASQYFLLTAVPVEGMWNGLKSGFQDNVGSLSMTYPQRMLSAHSNIEYIIKLYAGPKQIETLQTVHPTLDRSVDLGSWLGGLARGIHKLLGWIYKFIPNYGWAIIILTILVRIAVFPLAQMQARSMKRMISHKTAMDGLKEKYGKDREVYSRELMTYMRTHKINPASGCLPLLIQFPIFIALYRVLYNSVELRHAPFGFWIRDLSAHDPFFVLPVLVGITFFIQTKLNPTPMADPAQQTMMKIMPVLFSVFMIFLPSGLNLYIFVSTLWGIVQQYMVQKSLT